MSVFPLSALNKNQYRNFPIKQGLSFTSENGHIVPQDFVVGCSITTIFENSRIYIKQIAYINNTLSITIASIKGDDYEVIGVFSGTVTEDFTTLQLTPLIKYVSGNIVVGSFKSLLKIPNVVTFDKATSELEESTIFCYKAPEVKSFNDLAGRTASGFVSFGQLVNVTKYTDSTNNTIQFKANAPETLVNKSDKSSFLGNCKTPVIKTINGVEPSTKTGNSENDYNIYIAGIKPVVFYGVMGPGTNTTEPGTIGIATENMTLDSLCTQKHKLLPPLSISAFSIDSDEFKNKYYNKPALSAKTAGEDGVSFARPARRAGNFNSVGAPEYYFWPQFAKEEYFLNYKYWPTPE